MSSHRVGIGYDVHKLVPNRKLIIGGVSIVHNLGSLGYSDADVLIHAIADALLGAAALGDIGIHFPGNNPNNKDLPGTILLRDVVILLSKNNYQVINIDSTVILQTPAISKYIPKMREIISKILNVEIDQVSIKATTTDRLGFIGKEEGIAAEAIAMIRKR